MTIGHEILHLRFQREGETGDPVPENIQLTLLDKIRPPTQDDGEALLFRTFRHGQIIQMMDIYDGKLSGEETQPFYILWGTPFPPDGFIANKIRFDFDGKLAEFLDGDGEMLLKLLHDQPNSGEINLVYAFASSSSEDEQGFKDVTDDWSLRGVLDLSNIPNTADPIKTVFVLQEQEHDDHRQS